MVNLVDMMGDVSRGMQARFDETRTAMEHNLSRGEAHETTVRSFLEKYTPASIGVAHGELVDSTGAHSGQLDVIIYDARVAPLLYKDAGNQAVLMPAEAALAVVEVKSRVEASTLPKIIESMQRVKALQKSAYVDVPGITLKKDMYGKSNPVFPTIYSVFTFTAGSDESVMQGLRDQQASLPLEQQIDLLCVLGRSVAANVTLDMGTHELLSIMATPTPGSVAMFKPTEYSLLLWFLLLVSEVSGWTTPPIDLRKYLPDGFAF